MEPRERYRICYRDHDGALSERTIDLLKVGHSGGFEYFGVNHMGKFKSLRTDRVVSVIESLTQGPDGLPAASIRPAPTYHTRLPAFPLSGAVFRVPSSHGSRTWAVDLNAYTCTCPEKRIRTAAGYEPGELGMVCDHMAKAILDHLPADASGWTPELLDFLRNPRKIHIGSLG